MIKKLEALSEQLGDEVLIQPRAGFFRDAFCAAHFAVVRQADAVRLAHPEPRPDFKLRWEDRIESFEVIEADTPGRRRDQEFRREAAAGSGVRPFPEEEWLTPAVAESILRSAAERKARGGYDSSCRLLIYLNPIEFGVHQQAIEQLMKPATEAAASTFAEVWVLWKGRAYHAW